MITPYTWGAVFPAGPSCFSCGARPDYVSAAPEYVLACSLHTAHPFFNSARWYCLLCGAQTYSCSCQWKVAAITNVKET